MSRRLATIAAALGVLLALATFAYADEGWTIERFDSQIQIRADGSLGIVESIDVDFGTLQKHGIFRYVPVRYRFDEKNDRVYDLHVRSVVDGTGRGWKYETNDDGGNVVVKIGDPDRTISGRQSYRITYDVAGVLNGFPDHDELYWNVNGADWPVPTRAITARVTLPGGEVTQVACFQGPTGSTQQCPAQKAGAGMNASATRLLASGEQLTVVVGFPKGIVPEPVKKIEARPREIWEWWDTTPPALIAALVVGLLGLGALYWRWWTAGRDPGRDKAIVPEYEPPGKLRPAEVGLLMDESADPLDLTATIVHLAVRGYLRIEEVPAHGLFGKKDWKLVQLREPDGTLAPFEERLFDGLFPPKTSEVKLADLKGKFHSTLAEAEGDLYRQSVRNGWFPVDPNKVRGVWAGIGVLILIAGGAATFFLGSTFGYGITGLAVILVGIAVLAAARAMAKRSAKGRELLWHIHGFRRYMETAEKDRQQFAERENIFAEYLPYAIVFGLVSKWAAAFSGLSIEKATQGWYVGSSGFNSMSIPAFASGLSEFSSGLSTTMASTPGGSGSSGFGGGGFSGGGGGGGGGGSW